MISDVRDVVCCVLLSVVLFFSGCSSALVDSGSTGTVVRAPAAYGTMVPVGWNGRAGGESGEVSRVPASSVVNINGREEKSLYHEVAQGETLSGIARKYGLTLGVMLQSNGLEAKSVLQPGQLLYIPR